VAIMSKRSASYNRSTLNPQARAAPSTLTPLIGGRVPEGEGEGRGLNLGALEKPPSVGPKPSTDARALPPACGDPTDDGPCAVTILRLDGKCFRHSSETKPGEEPAARVRGGLRATGHLDAEVSPIRFRTRAEVAQAREEVFALVRAKALSAPSGTTLLMALRDQDASRDRGEQLTLDRKGPRPQEHRLVVRLVPWLGELAALHRRPPPPAVRAPCGSPESSPGLSTQRDFSGVGARLAPGAGAEVGSDGGSRVHLVIVQRSQDALYARLTSRPWQEAVTVIWDRRLYERRRAAHQGGRRHGEWRRSPPSPWGALGFLVVPRADASP
jgi:hypothetical protein